MARTLDRLQDPIMRTHALRDHLLAIELWRALATDDTAAADLGVAKCRRSMFDESLDPSVSSVRSLSSRPQVEHTSDVLVLP